MLTFPVLVAVSLLQAPPATRFAATVGGLPSLRSSTVPFMTMTVPPEADDAMSVRAIRRFSIPQRCDKSFHEKG